MFKTITFFLGAIICSIVTIAQSEKANSGTGPTKAFYGEIGGSGLLFSANYDSRFKGSNGLGFRLGIGGAGGTGGGILTVPVGLNYITGAGPSHFEFGVSVTFVSEAFDIDNNSGTWFTHPHFGYRYSKPANSFNGRIYVGPFIGEGFVFFPFGGISVGYTLSNNKKK